MNNLSPVPVHSDSVAVQCALWQCSASVVTCDTHTVSPEAQRRPEGSEAEPTTTSTRG